MKHATCRQHDGLSRREFLKGLAVMGAGAAAGLQGLSRGKANNMNDKEEKANDMNDKEDVLFAFDDLSIEATRGVKLEMVRPDKHPGNPILERGKTGEPDAQRANSPSVIYDNGLWRMWYAATFGNWYKSLVGYAESDDGITWRKPELGLFEYRGSVRNNIIRAERGMSTVSVIYDKEAPPEYRYVMAGEDMSWWGGWTLDAPSTTRLDVSPDGFHWKPLQDAPGIVSQMNETHTIYKFKGNYHIGGHQVSPLLRLPMQEYPTGKVHMLGPRTFVVWRSPRIDRWPLENTKAFFKPMRSSSPYMKAWDGEQVHLGASVKTYRNVCLGVYGQWHHPPVFDEEGEPQYDGPAVCADLGLIISNDGLHFREPAPGFTFVARDQELRWDRDYRDNKDKDNILLVQGSMVNTDELTYIYYSAFTPGGNAGEVSSNIGLATLPRDRFGHLSLIEESTTGQFVSCPLSYEQDMKLYVNADIPAGSSLQVYLLDEHGLDVLQGYGAAEGGEVKESGLDVEVVWRKKAFLPTGQRFRIRCEIEGKTRVFALYVRELGDVDLEPIPKR